MCTGVVSEEDTVSAWSSLKGLWRWVGLLVEALLLVGSEVVERGPLTVSVRSPSGRTGNTRQPFRHQLGTPGPKACLISGGRQASSSQSILTGVAPFQEWKPPASRTWDLCFKSNLEERHCHPLWVPPLTALNNLAEFESRASRLSRLQV